MAKALSFSNGIISATILPFTDDYRIDEVSLRKLVEYNLRASRINGLVCNAFAGETFALTSKERSEVIRIIKDQVDGRVPVIAGIWAEGIEDVKRETEIAEQAGADASLLFPPFSFARGATLTPEIPVRFHQMIADSTNLPIIAFQTRLGTGTHYTSETLAEISKIEKVIAVKNASFDLNKYEADTEAIRRAGGKVEILTGCDTLLASTMYLSDGGLLGLASLTPHFLSSLLELVKAKDLASAFELQDRYYPLVSAVYDHPAMDIPGRMKQGLVELGVIETAIVRGPWSQLRDSEKKKISNLVRDLELKEL